MLKAEKDPASQIGQVMAKNAETYGAPGLGTMDLMRFLKGKLAFDAKGRYRPPLGAATGVLLVPLSDMG